MGHGSTWLKVLKPVPWPGMAESEANMGMAVLFSKMGTKNGETPYGSHGPNRNRWFTVMKNGDFLELC